MPPIDIHAVLPRGSWRDAPAYAPLLGAGVRALAWELLRRDPAYAAARLTLGSDADTFAPASAGFAARWGLHFR